ncbi:MAG: TlpA family protein disulfide reductase [Leadbetterella sp.]|nr:TlpA family protein disulfide reductase [Leadbetterella sp.]
MKKILVLLLLALTARAQQNVPDRIVFQAYEDSLATELSDARNLDFLKDFTGRFEKYYDNAFQYERFATITVDVLEIELFEQRAAQKQLLEKAGITAFLKDHLSREADFQYWHLIYAYPVIRANNDQKSRRLVSVPEVITKGFRKQDLTNDSHLKYKAFRRLIPFYVSYENSREKNFEKYINMLLMVNDKVEYSLKHLQGKVADYSLAELLLAHKSSLSVSLAQQVVSQIEDEEIRKPFTGQYLDDVVQQQAAIAEKKRASEEKEKKTLTFSDRKGKSFALSEFKGKVVYIDFWASWCGPCKIQFPFAKKLHESLPGKLKKEVVFLYISIDDTVEKWQEGIKSNGLEDFVNGHVEGGWSAEILARLGIRSIPRYMLVDKNGKIVDDNAKRPNHPEILSDLIRLAE